VQQDTKWCSRCRQTKLRAEFPKTGGYCKPCLSEYSRARYRSNADGTRDRQLAWARENRDRVNELRRIRRANPEYRARERALDRERDRLRHPDRWIKTHYKLTREQWDALLEAQGGKCAICGRTDPLGIGKTNGFHVDHDHACCPGKKSCGKCVRGLLCNHCNPMLGHADDDPAILRSAADYLDRWRAVDPITTSGTAHSK